MANTYESLDSHLEAAYEDMHGDPFGFCSNSDGEFDFDPRDEEDDTECNGHLVAEGESDRVVYCDPNDDCPEA